MIYYMSIFNVDIKLLIIQHFFADLLFFLLLSEFLLSDIFFINFPSFLSEVRSYYEDSDGKDDVCEVSYDLCEEDVCKEIY